MHHSDAIVSSAVLVLKHLVQAQLRPGISTPLQQSQSPLKIISHLARKIDDIRHAQARACVLWLVGQYSERPSSGTESSDVAEWAPDVLRKAAKGFMHEV
jgi:AP-3 complex subunit beta